MQANTMNGATGQAVPSSSYLAGREWGESGADFLSSACGCHVMELTRQARGHAGLERAVMTCGKFAWALKT